MRTLVAALLLSPLMAIADTGWVELSADYQDYSNGFSSAQTYALSGSLKQATRTLYGEVSDYRRGDAHDTPVQLGIYQQITASGQLHAEGTLTASPLLKPEHQAYVGWYQSLPSGWTIEPGYQWTSYNTVDVEKASVIVEKYWQAYRFAYGAARVTLNGERAFNHRLQADWFYRDNSKLSAGLSRGDDQEVLDTGVVIQTPVSNYFLAGEHPLAKQWQLLWQLQHTDQGNIYRQQGARLGIRYQF
ncbi:MAG: YaiO family outer membrane beta-barrel protein [Pseudomonadota bacterium]